jgi:Skp family chaperone for outer membrane proteins
MVACAGCGQRGDSRQADNAAAGAVAIIDLDEIARRIGSEQQIVSAIAQRQSALSRQLVDLAKSYSAQIEEQKKKLAPEAENNQVRLASWEQQATANLNQVKQRAEADLRSTRDQLVTQFRDQIKPVARRIARERGLSVIVTKNDSVVFDYTATADITDAVVDELLASAAAKPIAPAPAQEPQSPQAETQQAAAPMGTTR